MQRAIIAPADMAGAALAELKHWLAITTAREDASLVALLAASVETCEAFTRQVPLEAEFEEVLNASQTWQRLCTLPVRSIVGVEGLALDASRLAIPPEQYLLDLGADGLGRVRLLTRPDAARIAVRFTAGIASDWESLPDGLRHGIIRLAAHHFRSREDAAGSALPAAIPALWQPWRRMRLA